MSEEWSWKQIGGTALVVVFVLPVGLFGVWTWTTVPAGHVGVMTSFGAVDDTVLSEGFSLKGFWKSVKDISVRTQENKEEANVPTKDGLSVHLEASLLYSLKPESAAKVFKKYGADYQNVIVNPQFRSVLRGATSHYSAADLYTENRTQIEEALLNDFRNTMSEEGILVEGVFLRDMQLPETVRRAIETKMAMDQSAQQMQFTIKKETLEAERKRVEAQGIADAQKIIQGTLTENYLRYKWIEALNNAADHHATMIYIPTGHDGLPLVKTIDGPPNKAKE